MRPQWRPNHWVTFSESLIQVLNLLDLLFLFPSVSRGLWSSGAIHATVGVILSIHWARPWVLMWCHQRTRQGCSESSLSWRQVIWDPCCNRGQISLSAEPSSSSLGLQRSYGCLPFLLPPERFLWQSILVPVACAEREYLTFQKLKHTDCIPDLSFTYMILPMQSSVCYQGLGSRQKNFGFYKILASATPSMWLCQI